MDRYLLAILHLRKDSTAFDCPVSLMRFAEHFHHIRRLAQQLRIMRSFCHSHSVLRTAQRRVQSPVEVVWLSTTL